MTGWRACQNQVVDLFRSLGCSAEVEKDKYIRKLRNLKWLIIASKLGGGVGYGGGIALGGLRNSYPEAYEAFKEELG